MLDPSRNDMPHCQFVRARMIRSPSPSRLVVIRMSAMAMSAVASVSTPGVLVATTSWARHAGTSMLL